MLETIRFAANSGSNYLRYALSSRLDRVMCKPVNVNVEITHRCNARCRMCDIWKMEGGSREELSIEAWKDILGEMRRWLGPFFINLSGGEPFMRRSIFDLLSYAHAHQIRTKISSNGILLTPSVCDRILASKLSFLSLSLDSADPERHDELRGVPGVHARAVGAIRYLRQQDPGMTLGVATVVMRENLDELPDLVRWAVDLGADRILFQPVQRAFGSVERSRQWYAQSDHWIRDIAELDRVVTQLIAMRRQGFPIWNTESSLETMKRYFRDPTSVVGSQPCQVGFTNFLIDPYGRVRYCYTVADIIGDVSQAKPEDVWLSPQAASVRRKVARCAAPCLLNCQRTRHLGEYMSLLRFFSRKGTLG